MAKRKKNEEKDNQVIYKTIHRKLKIDQHESHKKPGVNSGAPEDQAVPFQ